MEWGEVTRIDAVKIIKAYRPHKGFFDLSIQPKGLTKIEYAKILDTQNLLARENNNKEYLLKFNPTQWEKAREMSANLQRIIFEYWGDSVLD
jgi:hypothetical protein